MSADPEIGIVVPAYNEAENIPVLLSELANAFDGANCSFELLIVDDGSSDNTPSVIRELVRADSRVRGMVLTRNFGHQAAISIGLRHVRGNAVLIMDADLQDRPTDAL